MLDELARTATSLSCSLGPALGGGLAPLLAGLVRTDVRADAGRLRLYAAENDHAAVQKLAETPQLLGGLDGLPIEVIPLLVDRVCTARTISAGQVDTATEPWAGEIVVMTADDHKLKAAAMNDAYPFRFAEMWMFDPPWYFNLMWVPAARLERRTRMLRRCCAPRTHV